MDIALNSLLRISVKHTYLRGSTFYFRRPVPLDLRERVGRSCIKKNLQTSDPIRAAELVAKIKAELEADWDVLRGKSPTPQEATTEVLLPSWTIAGCRAQELKGSSPRLSLLKGILPNPLSLLPDNLKGRCQALGAENFLPVGSAVFVATTQQSGQLM